MTQAMLLTDGSSSRSSSAEARLTVQKIRARTAGGGRPSAVFTDRVEVPVATTARLRPRTDDANDASARLRGHIAQGGCRRSGVRARGRKWRNR